MANKKYVSDDVYNAAYRIVNEKHGYETGKAQGSSDYNKHHDNALADYEFLEQNDAELAHALKTNNYTKSMEILSNYAKKSDNTESTPAQVYSATSNTFLDRGNTVSKNIDTMYFDENYGKEIRDNFNAYGKTEGNQAAAGVAADNGGNFGSFADYNKQNTQLAYKVAGENAVQAKRSGYAADQSKFFDSWGGAVNTSNLNFGNYENTGKKIDADERMNQDDNETKLASYESNERIADKELEGIKHTNDSAIKKAELGDTREERGDDTPKLTLSQALSAVKSGVVTQPVLDAINSNWGTDFTLEDKLYYEGDVFKYNKKIDTAVTNPQQIGGDKQTRYSPKYLYSSDKAIELDNRLNFNPRPEDVEYAVVELIKLGLINDAYALAANRGYDTTAIDEALGIATND